MPHIDFPASMIKGRLVYVKPGRPVGYYILHPNLYHRLKYGCAPTACSCRNWQWSRFTVVR